MNSLASFLAWGMLLQPQRMGEYTRLKFSLNTLENFSCLLQLGFHRQVNCLCHGVCSDQMEPPSPGGTQEGVFSATHTRRKAHPHGGAGVLEEQVGRERMLIHWERTGYRRESQGWPWGATIDSGPTSRCFSSSLGVTTGCLWPSTVSFCKLGTHSSPEAQ